MVVSILINRCSQRTMRLAKGEKEIAIFYLPALLQVIYKSTFGKSRT